MNSNDNLGSTELRGSSFSRWQRFEFNRSLEMIGLASIGGALVFYDFIVFVFLAPVIGKLFFPPSGADYLATIQSLGVFAAGYFFRPLGGVVLAHFGDLFGRKRIFAFSIILMSISTLCIAILPTYNSIGMWAPLLLIVSRIFQGIAIGAEIPGGWTFVAEHLPYKNLGLGCGLVCAGFTFGILLASLVTAGITFGFSSLEIEDFAWRIPFLIGAVLGSPAILLRRRLKETPIFLSFIKDRPLEPQLPLKTVLENHTRSIIISMLLTWIVSAGIVVTTLMTSTLLETSYGYFAQHALTATSLGVVFVIIGLVANGVIIDRVGPGYSLMSGSIFLALATFAFYSWAGSSISSLYILYPIMGAAVGVLAAAPYIMVVAFPPHVRVTGISFSYNLSYAFFGGLTPVTLAWLVECDAMAPAYYLLFISALAFTLGKYLCRYRQAMKSHPDTLGTFFVWDR